MEDIYGMNGFPVRRIRKRRISAARVPGNLQCSSGRTHNGDQQIDPDLSLDTGDENFYANESDASSLGNTEALLYTCGFIVKSSISDEMAKQLCSSVPYVMTGVVGRVNFEHDVKPFMNKIIEEAGLQQETFCASCSHEVAGRLETCRNTNCRLFRIRLKRGKNTSPSILISLKLRNQLQRIITDNWTSIVDHHSQLHTGQNESRFDNRCYPYFTDQIESSQAFKNKNLTILLGLAYDGAVYKRIARDEAWPLFLEIVSLEMSERRKVENSALFSVYYGCAKPSDEILTLTFNRLSRAISELNNTPLQMNDFTLKFVVSCGMLDMAAQRMLFDIPRWNQQYGCSKCSIQGDKEGRLIHWHWNGLQQIDLKKPQDYVDRTPAMAVLLPHMCSMDWLHTCQEGVQRNRLNELLGKSKKFRAIRLNKEEVNCIGEMLEGATNYTFANAFVLNLENMSKCSGSELEQMYRVIIPVVCSTMHKHLPSLVILLGEWIIYHLLCDKANETFLRFVVMCINGLCLFENLEVAQAIGVHLAPVVHKLCKEIETMKYHMFFNHYLQEEAARMGPPEGLSTATSERWHKDLQIQVNQYSTNKCKVVERYILKLTLQSIIKKKYEDSEHLSSLWACDKRLKEDIALDQHRYIPTCSFLSAAVVSSDDIIFRKFSNSLLYSRVVMYGKCISCSYWRTSAKTRSDIVCIRKSSGAIGYGRVLFFEYDAKQCQAIVQLYNVSSPFTSLFSRLAASNPEDSNLLLFILRSVTKVNSYFLSVTNSAEVVHIPLSNVLSPAIVIEFKGRMFVARS